MPSFFSILKESLTIYKKNFLIFLSILVISFLAKLLISPIAYSDLSYGAILFFILALPIASWKSLAVLYALKDQTPKSWSSIFYPYSKTIKQLIPFSIVYVLTIFTIFGGFVFLIIPGLVICVYLCLFDYVYFFEGLKGLNAMSKSFEYIKGNWQNVAAKILVLTLLLFAISWIIPHFTAKLLPLNVYKIVSDFIVELITTPITAIFLYLIYRSLAENYSTKPEKSIELVFRKREVKLKAACIFGFLAFIALFSWIVVKHPNLLLQSYKKDEQNLTEEQKQEIIKLREKYPEASQIRIRIDENNLPNTTK